MVYRRPWCPWVGTDTWGGLRPGKMGWGVSGQVRRGSGSLVALFRMVGIKIDVRTYRQGPK